MHSLQAEAGEPARWVILGPPSELSKQAANAHEQISITNFRFGIYPLAGLSLPPKLDRLALGVSGFGHLSSNSGRPQPETAKKFDIFITPIETR